jgi:ribonuclease VapC
VSYSLDASAVLAALLEEPGGDFAGANLRGSEISVVNLSEVYATLIDHGLDFDEADAIVSPLPFRIRTFRDAHAFDTAKLRPLTKPFGLSLGDRACLAQAIMNGLPVLTGDRRMAEAAKVLKLDIRMIR